MDLIYTPLDLETKDSFRLLLLHPASHDSPVRCELKQAACETEQYEALSYTWGDDTPCREILFQGQKFMVKENLYQALLELRHAVNVKVIWIDALCINQNDFLERAQQVTIMPSVYSHAKRVLIWLGAEAEESDLAMDLMIEISRYTKLLPKNGRNQRQLWTDRQDENLVIATPLFHHDYARAWVTLDDLLSRPWWGRAWIVQEVALAKEILVSCGNKSVHWDAITDTANLTIAYQQHIAQALETAPGLDEAAMNTEWRGADRRDGFVASLVIIRSYNGVTDIGNKSTLSDYLEDNRGRLSTDPRDKLYSMLGLLSDEARVKIQVDYTKSYVQVFCDVVEYVLNTKADNPLDILCHSQHSQWYPYNPSWIPDWRLHYRSDMFGSDIKNRFHAYSDLVPEFEIIRNPSTPQTLSRDRSLFKVKGFVAGVVTQTKLEGEDRSEIAASIIHEGRRTEESAWDLQKVFKNISEQDIHTKNDENVATAFVRTLYADNIPSPLKEKMQQMSVGKQHTSSAQDFVDDIQHDDEVDFNAEIQSRTVFITSGGCLGIGSDFIQKGDLICILIGCSVPIILSKEEDGNYCFISDCYIHDDIMYGSEIKGLKDGKYQLQDFILS